MTKRNLLFVSLLLVFGLGAMAPSLFAQGTVWSASSNQNTIRNEGDAEAVGTITLTTTSTGTIESHSGFTLLYTLPIAYYKFPPVTYAVGISCSGPDAANLCAAVTVSVPGTPGTTKTVLLTFTNPAPLVIAGTPGHADAINVAVRVMSQGVSAGTNLTGTITAFYKFGNQSLTLTTTTGSIVVGLGTVQGPATTVTLTEGPEYDLTCIGVRDIRGTAYTNSFTLRIAENWNDALTSLSDEYSLENNNSDNFAGTPDTVYPTNGSEILITLSGIPSDGGVAVTAGNAVVCSPSECPGGDLVIEPPVSLAGGTEFYYVIDRTNVQAMEWADFPFMVSSAGPLLPNKGYYITASVTLTDLYPNTVTTPPPNGDMPWFSQPEGPPTTVVYFFDCVTKLLFPYINTFGGGASTTSPSFTSFGTGIDIADTTWDPFQLPGATPDTYLYPDEAVGAAVPQSGSCIFYFYPADESTLTVYVTPNISAGGSYAFDVATATRGLTPPFVNKTGYAIAICGFQNAHGFAEIYDNYANLGTGGPHTILGYLPEILPDPAFYPRSPAGEGLGEGAIAPINMDLMRRHHRRR